MTIIRRTTPEPRFYTRADIHGEPCIARLERPGAEPVAGRLRNVSEGGAAVLAAGTWASGEPVTVELRLPEADRVIVAPAVVRRVEDVSSDTSSRLIGLSFDELGEREVLAIRAYVAARDPLHWEAPSGDGQLPRAVAVRFVPQIRREAARLARRLPAHVSVEDLAGAGFVGLLEAYRRYQPGDADRFGPYALVRIRGAMLDELRESDPLSRTMRRRAREVAETVRRLEHGRNQTPSEHEIAEALEMSLDDYRALLGAVAAGPPVFLDAAPTPSAFPLRDSKAPMADEELIQDERMRKLDDAVAALPPRLRQVLELYYGEDHTLRAIGSILGVTESRVSQILSETVKRLRTEVATRPPEAPRRSR